MNQEWIVQIGHSRDGLRNYAAPANKRGYALCIIDFQSGAPSAARAELLGEPEAEKSIAIPGNRHDDLATAATAFAKSHRVRQVVAGFELFTATAAALRHDLGLTGPSPDVVNRFRSKFSQRRILSGRVLQPRSISCSSLADAEKAAKEAGSPCIIKPDDAGGSQGVRLVKYESELAAAYQNASSLVKDDGSQGSGLILLEEFISGEEFGVSGVVDGDGKPHVLAVTERSIHRGRDGASCMILRDVVMPTQLIPESIQALAQGAICGLGLANSPFDIDVRMPDSKTAVFIEAGCRITGGGVPACYRMLGFDLGEFALSAALGETLSMLPKYGFACGQEYVVSRGQPLAHRLALPAWSRMQDERAEVIFFGNNQPSGGGYAHISSRIGVVRVLATDVQRVHDILDEIVSKSLNGVHVS